MLKTALAAATLAAVAAAASTSVHAQDRDVRQQRLTELRPAQLLANPATGRRTVVLAQADQGQRGRSNARIAINPGRGGQGSDEVLGDNIRTRVPGTLNLTVNPGNGGQTASNDDRPDVLPRIATDPGQGQSSNTDIGAPQNPPRQQIVIAPGDGPSANTDNGRVPGNRQIVVEPSEPAAAGDFDSIPPIQVGDAGAPDVAPPAADPLDDEDLLDDLPNAAPQLPEPPAALAPEAPADDPALAAPQEQAPAVAERLDELQIHYRLASEGFYDVRIFKADATYYYVLAALGAHRPIGYVMAVNAYTGKVVSLREHEAGYRQAYHYERPTYRFAAPTYRFTTPSYSYRNVGSRYDDCFEPGYRY